MTDAAKSLLLQLALALALLAGTGLAAIGVSGGLAAGLGAWLGVAFVAGDPPGIAYTPTRCADFQRFHPEAADCAAAAAAHHFDEVVEYRLAAGLLGLLVLGGAATARRLVQRRLRVPALPDGFAATAGAALFGVAALALLGVSLPRLLLGEAAGTGALASGGLVAAVLALVYAGSLARTLRRRLEQAGQR